MRKNNSRSAKHLYENCTHGSLNPNSCYNYMVKKSMFAEDEPFSSKVINKGSIKSILLKSLNAPIPVNQHVSFARVNKSYQQYNSVDPSIGSLKPTSKTLKGSGN